MALALDASAPAAVKITAVQGTSTTTFTTASFTPPANSLLLISVSWDAAGGFVGTLSSGPTGGGLTYTTRVSRVVNSPTVANGAIFLITAPVTSSAAQTVSLVTNNGGTQTGDGLMKVLVLTGGGVTPTVGANGKNGSTTAGTTVSGSYTATGNGSWGFITVFDWNATGLPTAGTGMTLVDNSTSTGNSSSGVFRRTTADGVTGSATTLNVTLGGSSSDNSWAALEILDPGGAAPAAPLILSALYIGPY